ncbi:MAG: ATP-binding protein [Bacteroidales bacterium]|nr:ATP-binding protein [Candidatus Sodaliphilus aphodohippi]
MVERILGPKLLQLADKYPVITLTGPRQSGKSTLLRYTFADYGYVSLEDIDLREFAMTDPRGFLKTYPSHVIIDEAQRVPSLFSYLQTHVDKVDTPGMYVLAGSHNFMLMEAVNQSLAGRTAIVKLLPFSHAELHNADMLPDDIDVEIFRGSYPRIYDKDLEPSQYYDFYIQTYVERDVRLIKNIGNLNLFTRFVKLCAGRIGQLLNVSSLANECGISVPTVNAWLSVLEASYICYTLRPDWNNFAKRLVKTPKLYFYDTGLACSLLDIKSPSQVATHYQRGSLFENMVINSVIKRAWNNAATTDLRFWRDSQGNEVDLLQYDSEKPAAFEIKSGATFSPDYFKGLEKWAALSGAPSDHLSVVYGGEYALSTSQGELVPWEIFSNH